MTKSEIRTIIGKKNAENIPLTPEEKQAALQFYTEEEIVRFKHLVVSCNIKK